VEPEAAPKLGGAARLMQLSAESLTCVRGGRTVFSGLSFAVSSGEALSVVGRNGAGKSSLLRVIAGLVHLAAGTLSLSGGEHEAGIPEQAHYLGHQDALKGSLSVAENLTFWIDYLGGSRTNAAEALEAVDLHHLRACPLAISPQASGGGCPSRGWSR
jgi:heme exporter protein A